MPEDFLSVTSAAQKCPITQSLTANEAASFTVISVIWVFLHPDSEWKLCSFTHSHKSCSSKGPIKLPVLLGSRRPRRDVSFCTFTACDAKNPPASFAWHGKDSQTSNKSALNNCTEVVSCPNKPLFSGVSESNGRVPGQNVIQRQEPDVNERVQRGRCQIMLQAARKKKRLWHIQYKKKWRNLRVCLLKIQFQPVLLCIQLKRCPKPATSAFRRPRCPQTCPECVHTKSLDAKLARRDSGIDQKPTENSWYLKKHEQKNCPAATFVCHLTPHVNSVPASILFCHIYIVFFGETMK